MRQRQRFHSTNRIKYRTLGNWVYCSSGLSRPEKHRGGCAWCTCPACGNPNGRQPTAADIGANHHGNPDGEIPEPGLGHRHLWYTPKKKNKWRDTYIKKKWLLEECETTVGVKKNCANVKGRHIVLIFVLEAKQSMRKMGEQGLKFLVPPPPPHTVIEPFLKVTCYGVIWNRYSARPTEASSPGNKGWRIMSEFFNF